MTMDFGTKLKRLREVHGFSQEQVAFHCNISQAAYSKKEKGQRVPSIERLKQLSTLYEITVNDIVELSISSLLIIAHENQINKLKAHSSQE